MQATGQIGFDFKNDFIKRNNVKKAAYVPDKSPPEEIPLEPQTFESAPATNPPEDTFKYVQNKLKLNQSAMLPEEQSSSTNEQTASINKQNIATQKLEDLAGKSDTILLKVSTFWPFTFFVHDIIVDPYKVNIVFREFFWSEHIHSVMIRDILDVVVETSIFFATVRIVDQGYVENTIDVTYLKRADALKVRKVIQGLVIAHRQGVDLSILPSSQIRYQVEEMGKVKGIDAETVNF